MQRVRSNISKEDSLHACDYKQLFDDLKSVLLARKVLDDRVQHDKVGSDGLL
jgi:hypothetical protein